MADQPSFFKGWTEPESAANTDYPPDYPYNQVMQSASGHLFEMDDSRGRERVRLTHRTGTFIEMHPNGDEVHKGVRALAGRVQMRGEHHAVHGDF